MKQNLLGLEFDNVTMEEALAAGEAFLAGERPAVIVTPNAEIACSASEDAEFCALLNRADLVLPDGAGVLLAAGLRGTPLKEKVAGIDFARNLLPVFARRGTRLYLLGARPGVAEQAADQMRRMAPGLMICGTADGYFTEEAPVVEQINAVGAEALFVCLGAPKQERFMLAHRQELPTVRLMAGLGGSLDVFAGLVKRAPAWMIRLNLEWLYRLIREPKRLRRMLRIPIYLCKAAVRRNKQSFE